MDLSTHILTIKDGTDARAINDAIEALVVATRPVWSQWARHLGYDEAEQIARLTVWEAAAHYDPTRPARQYLWTVVRRRLMSEATHLTRRLRSGLRSLDEPHRDIDDGGSLADLLSDHREREIGEEMETMEVASILRTHLVTILTPVEYDALTMTTRGMMMVEVAQRIGSDAKSIDNGLVRCREKLAAYMLARGISDERDVVDRMTMMIATLRDETTADADGRVNWCPQSRKWRATYRKSGRTTHLGLFDRREEAEAVAAAARDRPKLVETLRERHRHRAKSGVKGVYWRAHGRWEAYERGTYVGTYDTVPEAKAALDAYRLSLTQIAKTVERTS